MRRLRRWDWFCIIDHECRWFILSRQFSFFRVHLKGQPWHGAVQKTLVRNPQISPAPWSHGRNCWPRDCKLCFWCYQPVCPFLQGQRSWRNLPAPSKSQRGCRIWSWNSAGWKQAVDGHGEGRDSSSWDPKAENARTYEPQSTLWDELQCSPVRPQAARPCDHRHRVARGDRGVPGQVEWVQRAGAAIGLPDHAPRSRIRRERGCAATGKPPCWACRVTSHVFNAPFHVTLRYTWQETGPLNPILSFWIKWSRYDARGFKMASILLTSSQWSSPCYANPPSLIGCKTLSGKDRDGRDGGLQQLQWI